MKFKVGDKIVAVSMRKGHKYEYGCATDVVPFGSEGTVKYLEGDTISCEFADPLYVSNFGFHPDEIRHLNPYYDTVKELTGGKQNV